MCAVLRFAFPQATSYAIPLSTITVFTLLCGAATSTKNALVKQKMHQPRAILVAASLYFFGWIPRQSFTYIFIYRFGWRVVRCAARRKCEKLHFSMVHLFRPPTT